MVKQRKTFLLIFALTVYLLSACKKETPIKNSQSALENESVHETNKETKAENKSTNRSNSEKITIDNENGKRDEILKLMNDDKIFKLKAIYESSKNSDFNINIDIENSPVELKDIDFLKIGISVEPFSEDVETYISDFNKSKKYINLPINNNKLQEQYSINLNKDSVYLSESDKELLINFSKGESIILRFDFYIDESSPIFVNNYFLDYE